MNVSHKLGRIESRTGGQIEVLGGQEVNSNPMKNWTCGKSQLSIRHSTRLTARFRGFGRTFCLIVIELRSITRTTWARGDDWLGSEEILLKDKGKTNSKIQTNRFFRSMTSLLTQLFSFLCSNSLLILFICKLSYAVVSPTGLG